MCFSLLRAYSFFSEPGSLVKGYAKVGKSVKFVVPFGKICVHTYKPYIYKTNIKIRNVILTVHCTFSSFFIVTFLKIDFFFFFRSRSHSKNPKR